MIICSHSWIINHCHPAFRKSCLTWTVCTEWPFSDGTLSLVATSNKLLSPPCTLTASNQFSTLISIYCSHFQTQRFISLSCAYLVTQVMTVFAGGDNWKCTFWSHDQKSKTLDDILKCSGLTVSPLFFFFFAYPA